jgi:DNA-binding transcriptional ArsR family regulator
MSHEATNWAIKQRGLAPPAKIVLWHLCDRYHPDHGCFPSQDTLARDCEISRSGLNLHLKALEEAGLIAREQRQDGKTKRKKSTVYRFAFEPDFRPVEGVEPCPEFGHGMGADSMSRTGQEPCPKTGESRVQILDSNPVREPVREPVIEREGADAGAGAPAPGSGSGTVPGSGSGAGSAGEEAETAGTTRTDREAEKLFWRLVKAWPGFDGMPKEKAKAEFLKLSPADQDEALDRRDDWFALLRAQKKTHTPAPSTYLREKLWQALPDKQPGSTEPVSGYAPAYGKAWGAARLADLMRPAYGPPVRLNRLDEKLIADGKADRDAILNRKRANCGWPGVNDMQDRAARFHKGVAADPALAPLADLFDKVRVGGALWNAWRALHDERGWPWFGSEVHLPEWIYFPAVPDGDHTSALEGVRAAMTRFEQVHQESLRPKDAAE